jgi:hypothetical protein
MSIVERMGTAFSATQHCGTSRHTGEIRFWRHLTDIGIFESKIGAWGAQILFLGSNGENHAWFGWISLKNRAEMRQRRLNYTPGSWV